MERAADVVEPENTVLSTLRAAGEAARSVANRHLLRGAFATSGVAAVLLQRVLPERHPILPDHGTIWDVVKLQLYVLSRLCGVAVTVHGRERLDGGPYVFVANHRSYFDLVALLAFLPGRIRFVVTKEMARHPFWGLVFRALGMIVLDESDTTPDALAAELERITADGSALVFPEGRRGEAGRVLPFMPLPFMAIVALGVPVVPVAVRGTGDVMPPGDGRGVWPGDVDLIVEGPIPTDHLIPSDYHPLREDVRAMIARYVEDLDALLGADAIEEGDGREPDGAGVTGFVPVAHAARA